MSGFLQGTHLGKYELIECIGQGGMADVYRAKQFSAFEREVALKVMRPEYTGDRVFRWRFLREAHAISRLSHPNILPLIEFGEEDEILYLVMPLVREGTLRDLLGQHDGPLSLEEVLPLFVPLCDAVQYAHQEGIIHRDIKPQNILLHRHRHVWLADFGIARDRLDTKMTTTGVGIGSVEYMAPEQAEGEASAQSDIYSLGVVLYQLLTGVVPYAGTVPLEVLFKKANDPLPDPRRLNPRLPAELVEVLHLALAQNPRERFATAEALGYAAQQVWPSATPTAFYAQMDGQPGPQSPAPLVNDFATTRRAAPRPTQDEHRWGTPAHTWAEDTTIPEEQWHQQGEYTPPDAGVPARHSRPRYILLVAALAFLALGITSIAYGRLSQSRLHTGASTTGAQQLTATPGIPTRPTSVPRPVGPIGPVGPVGTPPSQPASTATPQPAATPTARPATTVTPQPTETPTTRPAPSATLQPTPTPPAATPTTQPTTTPTPPAATPTTQPTTTPTPPAATPTAQLAPSATPQPTQTQTSQSAATQTPLGPVQSPGTSPGNAPTPGAQS
jgi:tRNA A-37 threonylcarbamoyl transferase component Bud32